jgi:hypothetical protein
MNDDNLLSKIPGEFLGSNNKGLPDAASCEEATQRVIVRLPDGARYELVYVRIRSKKGKTTRWFWTPASAVMIG